MKTADVAVVGAGPAGIAATLAAAEAGARVVLVDEQPAVGGQLRRRVAVIPGLEGDLEGLPGVHLARALGERLDAAGVEVVTNGIAWGLFEGNVLGVVADDVGFQLTAPAIVVASGTIAAAPPFPGWTLPGVMTAEATQLFLHVHRVLPGRRFAVVGSGPEADEVADDIRLAGAEVVCRFPAAADVAIAGGHGVERIESGRVAHEVDTVVLALGRRPDPGLALQAQIDIGFAEGAGGHVPLRGDRLETSSRGLYVAGDAAGIVSVEVAMAEGRLAGLAAAGADDRAIADAQAQLDRTRPAERRAVVARLLR